jgi:hypothetical protein
MKGIRFFSPQSVEDGGEKWKEGELENSFDEKELR